MSVHITTGLTHVPTKPAVSNTFTSRVSQYNDLTPSEPILFPSEDPKIIVLEPNRMAILTAYKLQPGVEIPIYKVLRSNGIPASTSGVPSNTCCVSVSMGNTVRLESVPIPCWKLSSASPVFVIKTPGSYEIETSFLPPDVVVTMEVFPIQEVNEFCLCPCSPSQDVPIITDQPIIVNEVPIEDEE